MGPAVCCAPEAHEAAAVPSCTAGAAPWLLGGLRGSATQTQCAIMRSPQGAHAEMHWALVHELNSTPASIIQVLTCEPTVLLHGPPCASATRVRQCRAVRHSTVWDGTENGTAQHRVAQDSMEWHSMALHGPASCLPPRLSPLHVLLPSAPSPLWGGSWHGALIPFRAPGLCCRIKDALLKAPLCPSSGRKLLFTLKKPFAEGQRCDLCRSQKLLR